MLAAEHPYRSIADVQRAISSGETTVKDVVEQYLKAIKKLDPEINAYTVTNQKALVVAQKLDVSPSTANGTTWSTLVFQMRGEALERRSRSRD